MVVQWCFAALNTVERPLLEIRLIDKFGGESRMPTGRSRPITLDHIFEIEGGKIVFLEIR